MKYIRDPNCGDGLLKELESNTPVQFWAPAGKIDFNDYRWEVSR